MNDSPLHDLISNRAFERYRAELKNSVEGLAIDFEVNYCRPTSNPAMWVGFDSKIYISRATVWESGLCDLEILEISSGEQVLFQHYECQNEAEFILKCRMIVDFMCEDLK